MPLRPEMRKFYGAEWRRQRVLIINALGCKCVVCGAESPSINLCHMNHDPRAGNSLVALMCFACHARHDTPQRVAMTRRTRARRVGQLWLLPEIEWAAYPTAFIPKRVLLQSQLRLF